MAKTEVILTHNIVGLGGESDQVKVAAGYARNFLFPQGFAIPLTSSNKRRIEALKQAPRRTRGARVQHHDRTFQGRRETDLRHQGQGGRRRKMFGSVTAGMIADELKHQFDITLDKRKIHLESPIKTLGEREVELHLHAEVKGALKIRVESLTPVILPVMEAAPAEARTEKRGKRPERAEKTEAAEEKPRATKEEKSAKAAKAPKAERKPSPNKLENYFYKAAENFCGFFVFTNVKYFDRLAQVWFILMNKD